MNKLKLSTFLFIFNGNTTHPSREFFSRNEYCTVTMVRLFDDQGNPTQGWTDYNEMRANPIIMKYMGGGIGTYGVPDGRQELFSARAKRNPSTNVESSNQQPFGLYAQNEEGIKFIGCAFLARSAILVKINDETIRAMDIQFLLTPQAQEEKLVFLAEQCIRSHLKEIYQRRDFLPINESTGDKKKIEVFTKDGLMALNIEYSLGLIEWTLILEKYFNSQMKDKVRKAQDQLNDITKNGRIKFGREFTFEEFIEYQKSDTSPTRTLITEPNQPSEGSFYSVINGLLIVALENRRYSRDIIIAKIKTLIAFDASENSSEGSDF